MDFETALNVVKLVLEQDWEVVILICAAIGLMKWVNLLPGGIYARVANLLSSALASGLFKNVTLVNGLRAVVFAFASALLYHFVVKIVAPGAVRLYSEMRLSAGAGDGKG